MSEIINCKACGEPCASLAHNRLYCDQCQCAKAPAVYRFVCPDDRSYVGAVSDIRRRADHGIQRSNTRLRLAFEQYPPETWRYEVLELLPPGCSKRKLHAAEQRHINRLRSCEPDSGFNVAPAYLFPKQRRARYEAAALKRLTAAGMIVRANREWQQSRGARE
jgi:hypothetical protein